MAEQKSLISKWLGELKIAEKEHQRFYKQGSAILKRYKDERSSEENDKKYAVLWSNTETLLPAIFARVPTPQVERRFKDRDDVGRVASEILQRTLSTILECDDFQYNAENCVKDYLLVARGQAWIRYVPVFGEPITSPPEETAPHASDDAQDEGESLRQVIYENVAVDYVNWRDFLHAKARTWDEVAWVAKKNYFSREELVERFGEEIGNAVPLDYSADPDKDKTKKPDNTQKAIVYEIWCKNSRKVYWVSKAYTADVLLTVDDPLQLKNFFPCPRPILATTTSESVVPYADYIFYQDQAKQLDELTRRIDLIQSAIKVIGFYDGSIQEDLGNLIVSPDNTMIGIKNFAALMNSSGLDGSITWFPVEKLAGVLHELIQLRDVIKKDIDEITGISDIVRGQSVATETATAQQIKGQYANMRINSRQKAVARFFRDIIRICAEIVSEHFSHDTLRIASGVDQFGQDARFFEQAVELLRSEKDRGFRIDIEADSTIEADDNAEKQARIEFMGAVGSFMQNALPVAQSVPEMTPLLLDMLLFTIRGFKVGRTIEGRFEEVASQIEQAAQQKAMQPPEPSPQMMKVEADIQAQHMKTVADIQNNRMKTAADIQVNQYKAAASEANKAQHTDMVV